MASTFSGIGTALSSLMAQRAALDVAGQNVANANTVGYTRQRTETQSVGGVGRASMFSGGTGVGNGVQVVSITRLGDIFLTNRLRTDTSSSGMLAARAAVYEGLESTIAEPSTTGVSASLQSFWAGWQDVGNNTSDQAARRVLLEQGTAVASQIATGYRGVQTQWSQLRTQTEALVTEVNTTAQSIANLNEQIRNIGVGGGSTNELQDQRDQLVLKMSELVGATATVNADGTMDVMVDGNPLVSGVGARSLVLEGGASMSTGATDPPRLRWSTGTAVSLAGGTLAGNLAALAPASSGGILQSAAAQYDTLAQTLAASVNALHATGYTAAGAAGGDFFTFSDPSLPPALGLTVAITDPAGVAASNSNAAGNELDGSVAAAIGKLGASDTGPDAVWQAFVVDVGVKSASAADRSKVSEAARTTSESLWLSATSVDLDEESVNMLAFQRAYEGAARVLTAVDEMLDTLINKTGVVGR